MYFRLITVPSTRLLFQNRIHSVLKRIQNFYAHKIFSDFFAIWLISEEHSNFLCLKKKNKKIHIFVSFSTYCRRKEEEIPVFFGLSEFSLHRSFKIRLEKQKLGLF